MKIYKSKNGYYIRPYVFKNGVKRQTTYHFKTKEEALEKILELKRGVSLSKKKINENYTFDFVWADFMSEQERRLKPTSFYSYKVNSEKHILPIFKGIAINEIKRPQISVFINYLSNLDVTEQHKNRLLNTLKIFFEFAVVNYDSGHEWVTNIRPFREDKRITKKRKAEYYTIKDFKKFISGTNKEIEIALFTTLMYSGLRIGELRALKWKDFDSKEGYLKVTKTLSSKIFNEQQSFEPKSFSSIRTVFLPSVVTKMLLELKLERKQKDGHFIFSGEKSLSETTIRRMNERIAAASEVKRIKIHEFRHSYATLMVKSGMSASILQKQLGHSDIKVTLQYYVHFEEEEQAEEVQNIFDSITEED